MRRIPNCRNIEKTTKERASRSHSLRNTQMTGWNALPPEIHHHILRLFCKDIIAKYTRRGSKLAQYEYWTSVSELRFPSTPSCLRDISSATRVCRSFYYSIVRDIKFDSVSAMGCLQKLQLSKVRAIVDYFTLQSTDRMPYGKLVHVGVFVKLAGIFWKNSLILEYHADISTVLHVLHKSSLMMLLPHLKEWVDRHTIVQEEDCGMWYASYEMSKRGSRDVVEVTFGNGARGSRHLDDGRDNPEMFTITGLYRGITKQMFNMWARRALGAGTSNDKLSDEELLELQTLSNHECRRAYPILQLVDEAKPDTWWVREWNAGTSEWLLINFEKRIVWNRHMRNVVCVWNGGDGMWEPKEWALVEVVDRQDWPTKTILKFLDETGGGEGNDGNGENAEKDDTESDRDESDGFEACSFDNDDHSAFEDEDDEDHEDGDDGGYEDEDDDDDGDGDGHWQSIISVSDQLFVAFSKAFE